MISLGGVLCVLTRYTRVSGRPPLGRSPVLRLLRLAEDRKYSHPTEGGKHPILHCTGHSDGAELILQP